MSARKRVRRANPYDLYRTCKQAGTCPPDVIPKVESSTLADKILQYGSLGVFLGGLGIGTGQARPGLGSYSPLKNVGSEISLSSLGKTPGVRVPAKPPAVAAKPPIAGGGIPAETLEALGAFRPSIVEDGILPEAPAIITPDAIPPDPGLDGLSISTDVSEETLITFLDPEGPEDIAVLELQPTEQSQWQVTNLQHHAATYHAPVQIQTPLGETSGLENIFVGGSGLGDTGGENIELTVFGGPRTSTPRAAEIKPSRGIFNWFSKRYYTQLPTEDPDFLSTQTFENPLYEGDAQILKGPSGRVGVSRIERPNFVTTRSGATAGQQVHVRYSLSSISEDLQVVTQQIDEDTQALALIPLHEEGGPFEEIELDDFGEEQPLLGTADRHGPIGSGIRRAIIPVLDSGVSKPLGVITYGGDSAGSIASDTVSARDIPSLVIDDHVTTPVIIIDGNTIDLYSSNFTLHPSLLKRKRKRKHA
ncbi:L2 [Bos taurus papillomavirus 14]|uniref:Minor capsid protein L2 n=1 Tax=Bos taurus papillomavirus 14 TaxID=2758381 RepID=A0A0E3X5N7_BPV1|nr:L2 [Bos taurus papillomavirus 14]ALL29335.1 L2 [Bos taurus papillomavirus 14]